MRQPLLILLMPVLLLGIAACGGLPGLSPADEEACPLAGVDFPYPEPDYDAKRVRDFTPFTAALDGFSAQRAAELDAALTGKTILDIQAMMDSGDLSSEELVTYYLDRIQRYDINRLNSVMELNPDALAIAQALDAERAAGSVRGDMHGIPVLLKDNIASGDGLHASAGAAAMGEWQPDRDAFLVAQLRDHGAVILGKANLSEWANWTDDCMPNGFSTLGGQTRNPYGPYDPLGSSSGSAAAAAASLSTVTVGSETQGSLIAPAGINSVVGLKTSKGLVSGDYIIPLLPFQDVAGPIGRNVTDVAVLLTAMAGVDENDPDTELAADLAGTDFTQFLSQDALDDIRVGVAVIPETEMAAIRDNDQLADDQKKILLDMWNGQNAAARQVGDALRAAGVEVVELPVSEVPVQPFVVPALTHGYKLAINEFLAGLGEQVSVHSLDDIVAYNGEDLANRAPYGQRNLQASLASDMSDADFAKMRDENISTTQAGFQTLFEEYDIDVLAGSSTQAYAPAGYPAITLPSGYDAAGQPVGQMLIAGHLGEPALIAAAYAVEQAIQARVEPDLAATMKQIDALSE